MKKHIEIVSIILPECFLTYIHILHDIGFAGGRIMHIRKMPDQASRARWFQSVAGRMWEFYQKLPVMLMASVLFCFLAPFPALAEGITAGEELTLQRAVDIALKNQPSILASQSSIRANEARVGQARASYYPQLDASGSYSKVSPATSSTSTGTSSGNIDRYDQYTSSVGLKQMIFDFGKTPTQVNISKLNAESSRFDLSNTRDVAILNVKQAYHNVLQARRLRDVARESVKQFQEHLEQARGFYRVGTKSKIDVTKAEVDLSNAQLNLIKAENQVKLSLVTLNSAMGIADAPQYSLQDNLFYVKYDLSLEEAASKAYNQRPDLQSLIKKKEASKASVDLARKGYFPILSGSANYNYTNTSFPLNEGWNYGLNLSIPLFSGFQTKYQVAEAQANHDTVSANEQSLRLDIYSQIQQAYLSLREADERIGTSELTVRQAKENVELATGRYRAGVGSPLEVTDALVGLNNAQVAYTQALTDYKNSQASIEKAIGVKE
ncbi:MAG: TolC family protein [Syntrophus sp. (in: bacteria)]|nr:TolC family protein [Syntrophus sp. (in: bacteria)]